MASSTTNMGRIKYKQDMPPPGGYKDFIFQRTFPKTWATAAKLGGLYMASFWYGLFMYRAFRRKQNTDDMELHEMNVVMQPFLLAERDRNKLKWRRYTREEEERIMKDVPGWKAETWYGEPIFFTKSHTFDDHVNLEVNFHSRYRDYWRFATWSDNDDYAGPHWWDNFLPQFLHDVVV